jgi:hypothetical protein
VAPPRSAACGCPEPGINAVDARFPPGPRSLAPWLRAAGTTGKRPILQPVRRAVAKLQEALADMDLGGGVAQGWSAAGQRPRKLRM